MSNWIEKYKPAYSLTRPKDDYLTAEFAATILLNIDFKSVLGRLLIAHRFNKTSEGKKLVVNGQLIENWVKEKFKTNPEFTDVLQEIDQNPAEFTDLFQKYLAVEDALGRSEVIMKSETAIPTNDGDDYLLNIAACIEWAESNHYKIDRSIKNAYKGVRPELSYTMPVVDRINDLNEWILEAIEKFEKDNGYPPTSTDEVINRLRYKFSSTKVTFDDEGKEVNIDSNVYPIDKIKKCISNLLKKIKFKG